MHRVARLRCFFLPLFPLVVPVHAGALGIFLLHIIVRNAVGHCAHELFPWAWTPRGWLGGITLFVCQTQVWRRAEPARCPPVAPP